MSKFVPIPGKPDCPSIFDVPCWCLCGWIGTVGTSEPDVDGEGSLGCPECLRVVEQDLTSFMQELEERGEGCDYG